MVARQSLLILSITIVATLAVMFAGAKTCVSSQPNTVRPGTPTPVPGLRIDLKHFTVDGIGLTSTADEVTKCFGPPQETQKIAVSEEVRKQLEEAEKAEAPVVRRIPEQHFNKIIYAYFDKGIKFTFDEAEMKVYNMELFVAQKPPYSQCKGLLGAISLDVRESQLLRPLASQIYKDQHNMLYLKKDGRQPLRETAVLAFNVEGWLTRITFKWEENYDIDIDDFCVGGVCLGDPAQKAIERFGPPDASSGKGNQLMAEWSREGLRIKARKNDKTITHIAVLPANFDGGFVQPLLLTNRKDAFHDYLTGRIYQEESTRICAYEKGKPRSVEKLILTFDEDDRLKTLAFGTIGNVEIDFTAMAAAGIKVGDPAEEVRQRLGRFGKWRDTGDSIVVGYGRYGIRVFMKKKGGGKEAQTSTPRWAELGNVNRIELTVKDHAGLYSVPLSLADTLETYEKKGRSQIFRRKGYALYMSQSGRAPNPGVAAVVAFEKLGWPYAVTFREFSDIVVDLKAFTVAGLGIGTPADQVFKALGTPERRRVTRKGDLEIFNYVKKGLTVVIDTMDRRICKINVDLERFEGSFAQELTLDSDSDDYEKVVHSLIYKQDEKTFWLSPDGKAPVWKEGVIYFGLTGDVKRISFLNLGVKKEGILLDITKELE